MRKPGVSETTGDMIDARFAHDPERGAFVASVEIVFHTPIMRRGPAVVACNGDLILHYLRGTA